MKTSEIKEFTAAELTERIAASRAELTRQKINHAVSPLENPTVLKKTRRDIARMLTVLEQKRNANS